MNLTDALLRSVPVSAAAALLVAIYVAIAKWRRKPLSARFEHALWTCVLAAMLTFAVPRITVHAGPPIVIAPVHYTEPAATIVAAPSSPAPVSIAKQRTMPGAITPWSAIWLLGASLMTLRILIGVYLTRRSLARARAIRPGVAESDSAVVPMTVGWPNARIILPTAWRTWPADKLRAVMLHEEAHVRRRDPLVTFLAAVNKAIFWFHPLAWWLERRLAELAEFAADDEAKDQLNPHDYAAVLIEIATSARPARLLLHPASVDFAQHGVKRISRRVDRIFDARTRTDSMKIVCAAASVIAALNLVQFERPVRAQEPVAKPVAAQITPPAKPVSRSPSKANEPAHLAPKPRLTFDAASVKPVPPDPSGRYFTTGVAGSTDPGRFHYTNSSLLILLHDAYNVDFFQIDGPGWMASECFDVQATMPPETTKEQLGEMLQNLLSDRFNLNVHRETRELPIYTLTLAKGGPKMKESPQTGAIEDDIFSDHPRQQGLMDPDGIPMIQLGHPGIAVIMGPYSRVIVKEQTMSQFAARLGWPLGRIVRDATGLTAEYDFTLNFANEGRGPQPEFEHAPDVRVALQEQLGLKLESGKGPVEVIVVDHVEKNPTEN